MKQILIIPLICYLSLLAEFAISDVLGQFWSPNLLLLVIVFFNLYSGIRFALWAAFCAGILQDCFSTMHFGSYMFVYMLIAYISTFIRQYYYQRGNSFSKLLMVSAVELLYVIVMGSLHHMVFEEVVWRDVWFSVWLPEWVITTAVALWFFTQLQKIAKLCRF